MKDAARTCFAIMVAAFAGADRHRRARRRGEPRHRAGVRPDGLRPGSGLRPAGALSAGALPAHDPLRSGRVDLEVAEQLRAIAGGGGAGGVGSGR